MIQLEQWPANGVLRHTGVDCGIASGAFFVMTSTHYCNKYNFTVINFNNYDYFKKNS